MLLTPEEAVTKLCAPSAKGPKRYCCVADRCTAWRFFWGLEAGALAGKVGYCSLTGSVSALDIQQNREATVRRRQEWLREQAAMIADLNANTGAFIAGTHSPRKTLLTAPSNDEPAGAPPIDDSKPTF